MTITKHPKTLLVVVAEADLQRQLLRDVRQFGAQGWTLTEVMGGGRSGVREGAWEADRTIELKIVCDPPVADAIAEHVLAAYAAHYGIAIYFSEVSVLRPDKY